MKWNRNGSNRNVWRGYSISKLPIGFGIHHLALIVQPRLFGSMVTLILTTHSHSPINSLPSTSKHVAHQLLNIKREKQKNNYKHICKKKSITQQQQQKKHHFTINMANRCQNRICLVLLSNISQSIKTKVCPEKKKKKEWMKLLVQYNVWYMAKFGKKSL